MEEEDDTACHLCRVFSLRIFYPDIAYIVSRAALLFRSLRDVSTVTIIIIRRPSIERASIFLEDASSDFILSFATKSSLLIFCIVLDFGGVTT